jgi:hypothetical protein
MGTWGFALLEDDLAADVFGDYIKRFNLKMPHNQIMNELLREYSDELDDSDDGPVVWLAVARAQWECGALDQQVLDRVRDVVAEGKGLDRWAQPGGRGLARRRKVLSTFLAKLRTVNPRPRGPRKPTHRKPIFQPGDCLAIRLSDGDYGGGLVLEHPSEGNAEDPAEETYGVNLIGILSYKSADKPPLGVFEKRHWHRGTHHSTSRGEVPPEIVNVPALGFGRAKGRIELVGRIELRDSDPKEQRQYIAGGPVYTMRFGTYSMWGHLGEDLVYQARWDAGERW